MTDNKNSMIHISEDTLKSISNLDYKTRFKSLNWTADINQELPIKMPLLKGAGSELPQTLPQLFFQRVFERKDELCM